MASQNEERAHRILDTAAELIERWGYKKTTIDDIAKQAGVAKGTIYLHWKTREDLFSALIIRERLRLGKVMVQQLENDSEGGTLHGMMRHTMLIALTHPLMKAIMLQDSEVLGELVHTDIGHSDSMQRIAGAKMLLEVLRSSEVIRTDISLDKQLHMLMSITTGFLMIDKYLPEPTGFSPEEIADMAAETIRRTFEVREATVNEQLEMTHTLNDVLERVREHSQKEVGL